ncbi:unnamed protein product [Boreogadus saida]
MAEKRGNAKKQGDSLDPYRYKMDYSCMGTCVIINNNNFSGKAPMTHHDSSYTSQDVLPRPGQRKRDGTDIDADSAEKIFKGLGYKIRRVNDQTAKNMEELLKDVSLEDHSGSASFACVMLSHGSEGTIFGTDRPSQIKTLTGYFRSKHCHKTLLAKPKLFFIQACCGDDTDLGCRTDSSLDKSSTRVRIPLEADFFYAYSTAQGYFSYRSVENGSWFMQALCENLKEHSSKLELMRIMTRVNHQVALDFGNGAFDMKQIPCIISMLTKDFFFP